MRFNIKCLWTMKLTTVIVILMNSLCHCKSTYGFSKDKDDIYSELNSSSYPDITSKKFIHDALAKTFTTDKRSWGSNFSVRSKWHYEDIPNKRDNEPHIDVADGRKWATFVTWGKRNYELLLDELDKRKWEKLTPRGKKVEMKNDLETARKQTAPWGEHDKELGTDIAVNIHNKRKWNRLAVWPKRRNEKETKDKRDWNKLGPWGKRPKIPKAWLALEPWGKQKWTGLTTWGKRSDDDFRATPLSIKLLRFIS
ncbi:uncharacterized protein LOC123536834 [Mercenaria mercenaria]|uniref:uncharacterized protein LOC123536834 n=1 Tax=Mercenaria mercenaria TaxID=6596 RepID=UPI00234E5CCE|nr:uncharacterized protein LOC123536834 [Mercenaria mercenaria]